MFTFELRHKTNPKTFRRFVDNRNARFQKRSHVYKFLVILNKQNPAIKYTVKFEDHKHSLNFQEINTTNNTTNKKTQIQSILKVSNHKHTN